MAWLAVRRATLLIPSGPNYDPTRKHLHIVITDPSATTGDVLIVCVNSIPTVTSIGYDGSCTLFPGEHPFIERDSYVAYRFTKIRPAGLLEEKVLSGEFIAKPMLDEKYLNHIIDGLRESPDVAPKYLRFFESTFN